MCEISEYALDRQFATQVRALAEVYDEKISCQNFDLSQHWLQAFQDIKPESKHARNGLMLLMISQLREKGRLGKPFVDKENMRRPLDNVLNEYDGRMDGELDSDALDTDSNASSFGGGSCRGFPEELLIDSQPKVDIDFLKKTNRDLLMEVKKTDRLFPSRYQLDKNLPKTSPVGKQELTFQERIWQATIRAIDRLKDWSGETQRIDFLATCFEPFLEREPLISGQIHELDRRLEFMIDDMVKQACERRYINMRMLYSCIFQHQKNCCKVRLEELEKSEKSLKEEKLKLRAYAEDLKRREDLIQRHEAIAVQVVKCPDPEKLLSLSPKSSDCGQCQRAAQKSRISYSKRASTLFHADGGGDLPDGKHL